ncbi:hypothetical protein [Octadecabacter ascidiaceicola]|uniref:Uncharacterized protein n=1 Tax=Octadecabacter ascidiaceicola TaxID=1655543 RepID=A0A238KP77_9RHOB|nr:hypothetical protein [Octadecabacter ascidiaceicola]SMX43836.1 hypothetical protein OCA8868_03049 [Octadecabacter ascidiaceicola]
MGKVDFKDALVGGLVLAVAVLFAALDSPNAIGLAAFWNKFGSLFVSLAAFLFAYWLALSATKTAMDMQRRTKLAEFRQSWINEFRKDVAELISLSDPIEETAERTRKRNLVVAKIRLRLNPKGSLEDEIRKTVANIALSESGDDFIASANDLTELVNTYLKTEWDVIKMELAGNK